MSLPLIAKIFVPLSLAVGGGTGIYFCWTGFAQSESSKANVEKREERKEDITTKNPEILEFLGNEGNKTNVKTMMDYLTVIDSGENKDIFKDFKNKHNEKKMDTNEGKKWINWKTESFHALLKNLKDKFKNDSIMNRENLSKLTEIMKKIYEENPTATDEEISRVPELFNKFFEQIKEIDKHIPREKV